MDGGTFAAGVGVGALAGLAAGPLLRAALTAAEYRRASREARLTEEFLRRLTEEHPGRPARRGPR